jgi:hypothetical protein
MKGGNYAVCNVVENNIYTWTTCFNLVNFNSQLTLFNGTNFLGSYLTYSDNACNSGGRIIWKATFTGQVAVLVNKKNCQTTQNHFINLSWECVSSDCDHPLQICSGSSIFPATTTQPSTYKPFTNTNWNCGSSATIINQTWYAFKVKQAGQIDLNVSSTVDVDGLVWGPYDSLSQSCAATTTVPISCNFGTPLAFPLGFSATAASVGKYFLVMISNSTSQAANINFSFLSSAGKIELCSPILSYNSPLCIGGNMQLFASSNEAGASYSWSGPNGWTSTNQNPIINNVNLSNAGTYSCSYTTSYGISTSNTIDVVFLPKPVTPNINHN